MTMIRPRSDVVYGIYRGLPSGPRRDEVRIGRGLPSELFPSRISEITGNYRNHQKKTYRNHHLKRTEITGTSCRYMFTGFKNVSFLTLSNMLMISSKKIGKIRRNRKSLSCMFLFRLASRPLLGREETEASRFLIGCGIMKSSCSKFNS